MPLKYCVLLLLTITMGACTRPPSIEQQLGITCNVLSQSLSQEIENEERLGFIMGELRSADVGPDIISAFDAIPLVDPFQRADILHISLNELTESEWHCPALFTLFEVRFYNEATGKPVNNSTDADLRFTVTSSGMYFIESIPFETISSADIQKYLPNPLETNIIIYMDSDTNEYLLSPLLDALAQSGVTDVSIADLSPPFPATTVEQLREEAKAYCAVFNPDNWAERHKQSLDASDIQRLLIDDLANAVKSDELYFAINNAPKRGIYFQQAYENIRLGISGVIGEEFHCPDLEAYFQFE